MENILCTRDLCKTYITNKRQNNVLKNVSLDVRKGEMTAIMGPSGSGKSTLLYAVSGMDGITAGEVQFCGKNIADLNQRELAGLRLNDMGFIFQQMYMLKNLTILDNIILPACQSGKLRESRKDTVARGLGLMHKLSIAEMAAKSNFFFQRKRTAGSSPLKMKTVRCPKQNSPVFLKVSSAAQMQKT